MAPVHNRLFLYDARDAFPVLCALGHLACLTATIVFFDALPAWGLGLAFLVVIFNYCWNMQSVSHNFIHNPYFVSTWLNRAFSILQSIVLGVPQTILHHFHLNHHWGDNDAKGPNGTTKDWSSTYRHGKGDAPEPFWSYCLIGFFRFELRPCIHMIWRAGARHVRLLLAECLALGLFWLALMFVNWRYLLFFYLPSYYLGWVLIYAHTYTMHHGAKPGNYYANSVSSYHRLYNWVFFNNGYHQEHHWDPKAHWTTMPRVKQAILPQMIANGTPTLHGPHITLFLERWLEVQRKQRPAQGGQERATAA